MIQRFALYLKQAERGSVAIETAFVVPVLAMLALGGFETSRIIARGNELQSAMSEAAAVVIANPPETVSDRNTIEAIVETSTGLAANKVSLSRRFRCNDDATLAAAVTSCTTGAEISEFLRINITDSYTPIWTTFGVGQAINFNITRNVQVS